MTAPAPPNMPSVEAETSPRAILTSYDPAKHTPATHSGMPGRTSSPGKAGEESRQESQKIQQTVASDLPSKGDKQKTRVSLPSTELEGAHPLERSGGVGALPGHLSESSVALLPDERQEREHERRPTSPRQRSETIKSSAGGGDEHKGLKKGEEKRIPRDTTSTRDEPVASHASDVSQNTTEAGVAGAVKSDIAATPKRGVELQKEKDEARSEEAQSKQWRAAAAAASEEPAEKTVGGSNLVSEKLNQDQKKSSSQDVLEGEHQEEQKSSHGRKVQPGYGGDYHPAQLHPPPPGASAAELESSVDLESHGGDVTTSTSGQQGTTGGDSKKPGFMSIMKGEMKILAGKMRGDEQKVEEGKKLVHGEI